MPQTSADSFLRYWDLSYDNFNYSYVEEATDKYNYCTFSYDRLGLGASSHGDPINEIQASLQVAALTELTLMLRKGTIPGIPEPFGKIVHVGLFMMIPENLLWES